MNSNGSRYYLIGGHGGLHTAGGVLSWRDDLCALTLAARQTPRIARTGIDAGLDAWRRAGPLFLDPFGALGRLNDQRTELQFATPPYRLWSPVTDQYEQPIEAPSGRFTDAHLGGDGLVALSYSDSDESGDGGDHGLALFHLRKRWRANIPLSAEPLRVQVDADNQTWVLHREHITLCAGEPLPHPYTPAPERFEPVTVTPHPPGVVAQIPLAHQVSEPQALLRIDRWLIVLAVAEIDGARLQRLYLHSTRPGDKAVHIQDLPRAFGFMADLGLLADGGVALLPVAEADTGGGHPARLDCPVLGLVHDPGEAPHLLLRRVRYPQLAQGRPRFVAGLDRRLRYIAGGEPDEPRSAQVASLHPLEPRELLPLAHPRYPAKASDTLAAIDSGEPQNHWHRLLIEACIPPECGLSIAVRCSDDQRELGDGPTALPFIDQPRPLWTPQTSELPFQHGWRTPQQAWQGLFEVLLQAPSGVVRELRGRFLQLRLQFRGDGRHTPAVHAIRAYYPRNGWQESFLPQHFRQQHAIDPAQQYRRGDQAAIPADGADLRQRLFACLEGMLTPIEDRIAAAEMLWDPYTAPAEMLPVLAATLGIRDFPGHWPLPRQRRLVANAGELQRRRGTLKGLNLALDIATDGEVQAGRIVAIENFRFRRTFSTLLGVPLEDQEHPLTLGTGISGNSIVGDTLILGREGAREFLALLAPELDPEGRDEQRVGEFFEHYAHRLSVLLHGDARRWQVNVEASLREYAPAHLQWIIKATDHPFVLGLAPLLKLDTYLERRPPFKRMVLDSTPIGRHGLVVNESALSPTHAGIRQRPNGDP